MRILNNLIEDVLKQIPLDWTEFLQNLSLTQKEHFFHCNNKDVIKLYYIALKYGLQPNKQKEVFSFDINSPEKNHMFGKGTQSGDIHKYVSGITEKLYSDCPFFRKTLSLLPDYIHTCWIVFLKNGCRINNWVVTDSAKEQMQTIIYVLTKDIKNGSLVVNDTKYNKKGEYFIIDEETSVSMLMEGTKAELFAFEVNREDSDKVFVN